MLLIVFIVYEHNWFNQRFLLSVQRVIIIYRQQKEESENINTYSLNSGDCGHPPTVKLHTCSQGERDQASQPSN